VRRIECLANIIVNTNNLSPAVTIGIPVFNGEKFIGHAIESVLAQTFADYELLVSDNASEDRTVAICNEYVAKDKRIRLIRHDKNRGPYWNLKFVTDQARGRFLVWLAHDDALGNRFVEECLAQMSRNSRAVLVSGDFRIIDESGDVIRVEMLKSIREQIPWMRRCGEFFKYPIFSNVFYCFYGMTKTDVCQSVMGDLTDPKYMSQIELPVLARLAAVGEIFSFPMVLRDYRKVSTSLYHSERISLLRKSMYSRFLIQTKHVIRLMADQTVVLVRSRLSLRLKFRVLLGVGPYYCGKLLEIIGGKKL
jgi:glycosyltransferase involved in cell wall biosynthesis